MSTYTGDILQLIDENPGISAAEIDRRLGLEGRNVEGLIRPYVKGGHIIVEKLLVKGERRTLAKFRAASSLEDFPRPAGRCAYKKWTVEDLETLIRLYPDHSNSSIAKHLDRTLKQIKSKAKKLKLRKPGVCVKKPTYTTHWSAQDVRILQNLYCDKTATVLAELLGKSESQIFKRARKLGLRKSDAFWQQCGARLMSRGAETEFKIDPIGTERIWNRYIAIKVGNPSVWEFKQQQVWRAHRGEYSTKTHTLWFIDRNPMNCDISNLELITKSEMMKRTSIMKYPKELRDVITLHNKLKRRLHEQHRDIA